MTACGRAVESALGRHHGASSNDASICSESPALAHAADLSAAGTTDAVADVVAGSLVNANVAGHDSHGVLRIPEYLGQIERGTVRGDAEPTVLEETASTLLLDGNDGFGHYTARHAMTRAIDKARRSESGCVSLVRTGHIGRLGEYAEQAAHAGCIGIVTVGQGQGGRGITAPFGGAQGALATNPVAVGVPTGDDAPFIIDFATSMVAEGKLRVARSQGRGPAGGLHRRPARCSQRQARGLLRRRLPAAVRQPQGLRAGTADLSPRRVVGPLRPGAGRHGRGLPAGHRRGCADAVAGLSAGRSRLPGRHQADTAGARLRTRCWSRAISSIAAACSAWRTASSCRT